MVLYESCDELQSENLKKIITITLSKSSPSFFLWRVHRLVYPYNGYLSSTDDWFQRSWLHRYYQWWGVCLGASLVLWRKMSRSQFLFLYVYSNLFACITSTNRWLYLLQLCYVTSSQLWWHNEDMQKKTVGCRSNDRRSLYFLYIKRSKSTKHLSCPVSFFATQEAHLAQTKDFSSSTYYSSRMDVVSGNT